MKKDVHPTVYQDATTNCTTCSAVYAIPSTIQKQSVEACRACHSAYTGKKQTTLKGGRVERFRKLQAAAQK
jgi:large subunit ribosomal protein L31